MSKKNKNKSKNTPKDETKPDAVSEAPADLKEEDQDGGPEEGEGNDETLTEGEGGEDTAAAGDTPGADEGETDPADDEPKGDIALLGSNVQPAIFKLADGTEVQLGDIVRAAVDASGMTTEEWNKTVVESPELTEAAIQAEVDKLELAPAEDETPAAPAPQRRSRAKKAEKTLEDFKIRWINFDRRKALRVIQPFEYDGVQYERGEIFDWAVLGVKPHHVRRLYNRKVVRHVYEDHGIRYPFRPELPAPPQAEENPQENPDENDQDQNPAEGGDDATAEKEDGKPDAGKPKFSKKGEHRTK